MERDMQHIGRGWSFPPQFTTGEKGVRMTTGKEDIDQSLTILFGTFLGERVLLPEYGCDLTALVFESLSTTFKTFILDKVEKAILYHEPRIDLITADIVPAQDNEGVLLIKLEYRIRTTNSRTNFVYPFYKVEASEINHEK